MKKEDTQSPKKDKRGRKRTGQKGEKKTFYLSRIVIKLLEEEAEEEDRSASKTLDRILRDRYKDKIDQEEDEN